jgi:hypothetical protein
MMIQLGTSKPTLAEGVSLLENIERLTDLYTVFIDETIQWEKGKPMATGVDVYDRHELKYILGYIAYYKFTNPSLLYTEDHISRNGRLSFDREKVKVIRDFWLRTGIITKDSEQDSIAFRHIGFQSYGVAFILAHYEREKINEMIVQHKDDPNWHLIFLLFSGLTSREKTQ